jgi:hypothetical protein
MYILENCVSDSHKRIGFNHVANITNNDTTICRGSSITLNAAAVNASSVTDINGNVYPSVNIGAQTWMQKNLNVSKYKNGDIKSKTVEAIFNIVNHKDDNDDKKKELIFKDQHDPNEMFLKIINLLPNYFNFSFANIFTIDAITISAAPP